MGPNKFLTKENLGPKKFGLKKNFGSKTKYGSKHMLGPKILLSVVKHQFLLREILGKECIPTGSHEEENALSFYLALPLILSLI